VSETLFGGSALDRSFGREEKSKNSPENRFFRKKSFFEKSRYLKKSEIGENLIFSKKKLFRKKVAT
jgi:hypothetical protein